MPMVGTKSVEEHIRRVGYAVVWKPVVAEVARAGDLGYTYGSFEAMPSASGESNSVKGFYLHVWKRNAMGVWKLVADVANSISG